MCGHIGIGDSLAGPVFARPLFLIKMQLLYALQWLENMYISRAANLLSSHANS